MRHFSLIFVVFLLLTGCATSTPSFPPLPESLVLEDNLDGWELGNRTRVPGIGFLQEMIPEGEAMENWSKLVSVEFLDNQQVDIEEFARNLAELRKEQCAERTFELLETDAYNAYYTFSSLDCPQMARYSEISRLIMGEAGIHRVSFATRERPLTGEERQHWLSVLRSAYIVRGEDPDQRIRQ